MTHYNSAVGTVTLTVPTLKKIRLWSAFGMSLPGHAEALTETRLNQLCPGPAGELRETVTDTRESQKHCYVPAICVCVYMSAMRGPWGHGERNNSYRGCSSSLGSLVNSPSAAVTLLTPTLSVALQVFPVFSRPCPFKPLSSIKDHMYLKLQDEH